jgi:hypothetical protein
MAELNGRIAITYTTAIITNSAANARMAVKWCGSDSNRGGTDETSARIHSPIQSNTLWLHREIYPLGTSVFLSNEMPAFERGLVVIFVLVRALRQFDLAVRNFLIRNVR